MSGRQMALVIAIILAPIAFVMAMYTLAASTRR